jgi:hypothetical protein
MTLIISGAGILPVKAQFQQIVPSLEIAQSTDPAKNEMLQKRAVEIIDLLVAEKYGQVKENISAEVRQKLSAQFIEQLWDNLLLGTGPVKKYLDINVINTINADLVIIDTEFENTTGEFIVTFNENGEIVGIDLPKIDSIDRIAQIFVTSLANNDYPRARAYLHPYLKTEIFPQQVKSKWDNLLAQNGRVKKIVETQTRSGLGDDRIEMVTVTIEFETTTDDLLIIFDEQRRIVGVDIPLTEKNGIQGPS